MQSTSEDDKHSSDSPETDSIAKKSTTKRYPRRPSPIPEEQLAKDRELSRKLYRILYALPFLVVAIAFLLYQLTRA